MIQAWRSVKFNISENKLHLWALEASHRASRFNSSRVVAGTSGRNHGNANGSASMPSVQGSKTLHLLRHGETEMNIWLGGVPADREYEDPLLYDTVLTENGKRQAAAAAAHVLSLTPAPELLVSSPLTRALQTAELAFQGVQCPRIVTHWATERLYHASDVGQEASVLQDSWPQWNFDSVPSGAWWHTANPQDLKTVSVQTDDAFFERLLKLRAFLLERPEKSIALVTHWGVLNGLTGRSFDNAELQTMT